MKKYLLALMSLTTAVVPAITTIACSNDGGTPAAHIPLDHIGVPGWTLMSPQEYNAFYDTLNPKTEVGIAIIAYDKIYTDIVSVADKAYSVSDAVDKSEHLEIEYHWTSDLGNWMQRFKDHRVHTEWQKGVSDETNYGQFFPMYTVNHIYSNFGVSNHTCVPGEIYEITYDHNALGNGSR